MEEINNNLTITKDNSQTVLVDEIEDNEDSLTKPKKKYNYYNKKNPEDDKRKIKERTPKQLEALEKGRLKIKERTNNKKKEIIEKYLEEQKSSNTLETKEIDEKENVIASSSDKKKKKQKVHSKHKKIAIYLSDSSSNSDCENSSSDDENFIYESKPKSRINRQPSKDVNTIPQQFPKVDYRSFFC